MAFESTNAILGINEDQRAKKDSTWKKLMDIASLGSNLWGTVSGRKFSREERIGGEQADLNKLSMSHLYNMEELGQRLENDKNFQIFKTQNPEKPANQLYAEFLQTPEGQAWQDDQARRDTEAGRQEHGWRMEEIRSGKQGVGMSDDAWKTYDNAIDRAIASYYEVDQSGRYVLRKGVTQDQIRDFLYGFLDPAFASENDIPGLRKAFDMWLTNPDFPGQGQQAAKGGNEELTAALEAFRELAKGMAPKEVPPARAPGAAIISSDSGIGGQIGTQVLDYSNREYQLEKNLKGLLANKNIEEGDKRLAEHALTQSSKKGFLSEEDYQTFMAVVQVLQKKYGGVRATK